MFAYCRNAPVSRVDVMGRLDDDCTQESNNEDNIRQFFGLSEDDELPALEDGVMLFIENITCFPTPIPNVSVLRGYSVLFDYDKYCEYYFVGLSYGRSGLPYDCIETKGYVYGMEKVDDFKGFFLGGAYNSLVDSDGGAIALNGVKAIIISGQAFSASVSISLSYYFSLSKDWIYGKASIIWHPAMYGSPTRKINGDYMV